MRYKDQSRRALLVAFFCWTLPSVTQAVPWLVYEDSETGEKCGLINAASDELVIDELTGELIIINGEDTILPDTFVDDAGNFFFNDVFSGFVEFAVDGDGLTSLWLFTLFSDVADINEFTGEITETGFLPGDFVDLPCNACDFWDDLSVCVDDDIDGVDDHLDDCLDTPLDEEIDSVGCSCSQRDDDNDGVDNCDDSCPNTHEGDFVDVVGCILPAPIDDTPVIVLCGNVGVLMPFLMGLGLVSMRRRVRVSR